MIIINLSCVFSRYCTVLLTKKQATYFTSDSIVGSRVYLKRRAMPGYRVYSQDGGEVRDGLTCSYCKLMLKDPVQTTETGKRFCKGCFEKAKAYVIFANVCLFVSMSVHSHSHEKKGLYILYIAYAKSSHFMRNSC